MLPFIASKNCGRRRGSENLLWACSLELGSTLSGCHRYLGLLVSTADIPSVLCEEKRKFEMLRSIIMKKQFGSSALKFVAGTGNNSAANSIVSTKYQYMPLIASNASTYLESKRYYRMTRQQDSALIVTGLAMYGTFIVLEHANGMYSEYQANKQANPTADPAGPAGAAGAAGATGEQSQQQASASAEQANTTNAKADTQQKQQQQQQQQQQEASTSWTSSWFARNFYEGGFEDKMTKREAALILGVRESATPERIKDAHRKILLINHPDRGGSAYVAAKINEAKDLLIKTK
jgi:DnaJ family protein C protein 19